MFYLNCFLRHDLDAALQWFRGGYTNACYNALDRHVLAGHGHQMAILWEGNDPGQSAFLSYSDILKKVCQVRILRAEMTLRYFNPPQTRELSGI